MPILEQAGPLDQLHSISNDPGFLYMESQRSWSHKLQFDSQRIKEFYENVRQGVLPGAQPKDYPLSKEFPLTVDKSLLEVSFLQILANRQTRRTSDPSRPLDPVRFATWLLSGNGAQSFFGELKQERNLRKTRTSAGPGGLYATELYFLNTGLSGLPLGVFHLHPTKGVLQLLRTDVSPAQMGSILIESKARAALQDGGVGVVVATSVFSRLRVKYGPRFLRFALIEAGLTYQALDYAACALNLMLFPQGATLEAETRQILQIDGVTESAVWTAVVGP